MIRARASQQQSPFPLHTHTSTTQPAHHPPHPSLLLPLSLDPIKAPPRTVVAPTSSPGRSARRRSRMNAKAAPDASGPSSRRCRTDSATRRPAARNSEARRSLTSRSWSFVVVWCCCCSVQCAMCVC